MALKKDFKMKPHQKDASDKLLKEDGSLLFAHDVGTGKTAAAIGGFYKLKDAGKAKRTLIVTPASLRDNFGKNGIEKFTNDKYVIFGNKQEAAGKHPDIVDVDSYVPRKDVTHSIVSYDLFKRDPKKYIDKAKADTIVYDELHRAKNETSKVTEAIKDARKYHKNFIGLTGSIVSNTPADIVPLVDAMTDGKHTLGSKASFESRFLDIGSRGRKKVKSPRIVRALTSKYIHHVDKEDLDAEAPPKKISKTKNIVMGDIQSALYRHALDKLDAATKLKLKAGIGSLKDSELKSISNKLMAARQASNAPHTMDTKMPISKSFDESNKAKQLVSDTVEHLKKDKDNQVIIGTQFIKGGVDILSEGLKRNKVPFTVFVGKGNKGVTEKSRQKAVKDFNAGKARAIVISGAGGEGLNLPNTTAINMFDGHFNPEVMNQMEARGIRSGGQAHKKPKDRKVEVTRYMSHPDRKVIDTSMKIADAISPMTYLKRALNEEKILQNPLKRDFSTEEFIADIAKNKEDNNKELKGLFKASKLIDSDSKVMEDYYNRFGKDIDDVIGTNKRISDDEKEYIDRLRKVYRQVATSKNYENMNQGKNKITYSKKDFNSKGKLKASAYLSGSKNNNHALRLSATGAAVFPMVSFGALSNLAMFGQRKKALMGLAALAGTGAVVSPLLDYVSSRNKDYGTIVKSKAKKRLKLNNDDLVRLLRGENITKSIEKKEDHFI